MPFTTFLLCSRHSAGNYKVNVRALLYTWENGGFHLVQVHGTSGWWKPELSPGLSWLRRASFAHIWPCPWVVLPCEFISQWSLTASLPQTLLSFHFAYEETEIQRRKLTCRTSQNSEDTRALLPFWPHEESRYYKLEERIEVLGVSGGTGILESGTQGFNLCSAAQTWETWIKFMSIAVYQFLPL